MLRFWFVILIRMDEILAFLAISPEVAPLWRYSFGNEKKGLRALEEINTRALVSLLCSSHIKIRYLQILLESLAALQEHRCSLLVEKVRRALQWSLVSFQRRDLASKPRKNIVKARQITTVLTTTNNVVSTYDAMHDNILLPDWNATAGAVFPQTLFSHMSSLTAKDTTPMSLQQEDSKGVSLNKLFSTSAIALGSESLNLNLLRSGTSVMNVASSEPNLSLHIADLEFGEARDNFDFAYSMEVDAPKAKTPAQEAKTLPYIELSSLNLSLDEPVQEQECLIARKDKRQNGHDTSEHVAEQPHDASASIPSCYMDTRATLAEEELSVMQLTTMRTALCVRPLVCENIASIQLDLPRMRLKSRGRTREPQNYMVGWQLFSSAYEKVFTLPVPLCTNAQFNEFTENPQGGNLSYAGGSIEPDFFNGQEPGMQGLLPLDDLPRLFQDSLRDTLDDTRREATEDQPPVKTAESQSNEAAIRGDVYSRIKSLSCVLFSELSAGCRRIDSGQLFVVLMKLCSEGLIDLTQKDAKAQIVITACDRHHSP